MKSKQSLVIQMLTSAQRRFVRARPGSILIFVAALLVLIALAGTAFLSTARIDRYTASQHTANTQIDLLVEGVVNLAVSNIVGQDLFVGQAYRPPNTTYEHFDAELTDIHLASRLPVLDAGAVYWPHISWPLVPNGPAAATTPYVFDRPDGGASIPLSITPTVAREQLYFLPTSAALNGNPAFPHMRIGLRAGAVGGVDIPAADVDGDGIADAMLWKLPISPINGVTYYAASRTIDANSAVNASVAWQPAPAPGVVTTPPGNFFPTNVNLEEMLKTATRATELALHNAYRFDNAAGTVSLAPFDDAAPTATRAATPRPDFEFVSTYDAVWNQLGRRLQYPGFNASAAEEYVAFQINDTVANAYRFCIANPSASKSVLELKLPESLKAPLLSGKPRSTPYAADEAATWFTENFDYPALGAPTDKPIRAITVGRNPVANAAPSHSLNRGAWAAGATYSFGDWVVQGDETYVCVQPNTAAPTNDPALALAMPHEQSPFWQKVPWRTLPVRASANTAPFGELWHAFWDTMVEGTSAAPTLPGAALAGAANTGNGVFRPATRFFPNTPVPAGAPAMTSYHQMQIRAALAAVNTLDLRDSDNDVTSRKITVHTAGSFAPDYEVTVFGAEPQPYITEVLTDNNAVPYIAVELYNPYPFPIILTNWQLATIPRANPTVYPLVMTRVGTTDIGTPLGTAQGGLLTIPQNGFVLLEEGAPPADIEAVTIVNAAARGVTAVRVPFTGLSSAIGQELVLLRPRRADGQLSASVAADNPVSPFNEGTIAVPELHEMVPADQIDLFATGAAGRYEYRRSMLASATVPSWAWHLVYSGGYSNATPAPFINRHEGLLLDAATTGNLLGFKGATPAGVAGLNTAATYETSPIQIANTDMGGPNKTVDPMTNAVLAAPYHFPFGGFARNGDLLQIPFIGAYRISPVGAPVPAADMLEMNSLPMDSALADDTDPTNNTTAASTGAMASGSEQIGRFCLTGDPVAMTADYAVPPDPAVDAAGYAAVLAGYRYRWAADLLDYLTVQSPADDYLPNFDPNLADVTAPAALAKYPTPPSPTANASQTTANDAVANAIPASTEDTLPVEGLININTASWRVLATLPMLPVPADNELLAKQIVAYRDGTAAAAGHPPFQSIYDLYRVPEFTAAQDIAVTTGEPDDVDGDISPLGAAAFDTVRGDFEERFLLVNRISNLITTRSDSYICYLLIQGWENAGTANATVKVQRRVAFVVDRSMVTSVNPTPTITYIPTN